MDVDCQKKKLATVIDWYEAYIKFKYNIFHGTYLPYKTEDMTAINEAKGNKQVGAVSLIFLMYNKLKEGWATH